MGGINNRTSHIHVLGSTDAGKSKFLQSLIRADIEAGRGGCVIDPHGTLIDDTLKWCAGNTYTQNVQCIDFRSPESLPVFNPLATTSNSASFVVERTIDAILSVFHADSSDQTPLLERVMRATFRLLADGNRPLTDSLRLISREYSFITWLLGKTDDPQTHVDWEEFQDASKAKFRDQFGSFKNRLSRFLSNPYLQHAFSYSEGGLDMSKVMNESTMLLVNVSPNQNMNGSQVRVFGTLLVNEILTRSFERHEGSPRFHVYIDECAEYVTREMAKLLDQVRKRRMFVTLAHQSLAQLETAGVYESVMTNARTKAVFGGLSYDDAEVMTKNTQFIALAEDSIPHVLDRPTVVGYRRVFLNTYQDGDSWSLSVPTHPDKGVGHEGVGSNKSYGMSETNEPILQPRPTTLRSVEDKKTKLIATLMGLPQGMCLMKPAKKPAPQFYQTPFIPNGSAQHDRTLTFQTKTLAHSPFNSPLKTLPRVTENFQKAQAYYEDTRHGSDDFLA